MSTPETTLYLCSGVPLNSRYSHSLYFADKTAQLNYMRGFVDKTLPAYSFIRRSWSLKVEGDLSEAVRWNYLFFRYPSDEKYYYYFINRVEYINDGTVELFLELDLLQTYLFDISFKDCLIEREHVTNDTVGKHTVSEGIEAGELVYQKTQTLTDLTDYVIMILASFNPYTTTSPTNAVTKGGLYGGVYSGLGLYAVPIEKYKNLSDKIAALAEQNLVEGIVSMWVYPKRLLVLEGEEGWGDDVWCFNVSHTATPTYNFSPSKSFGSYTPKNNKLFTYPYNLLEISNNSGSTVTYRHEFLLESDQGYLFYVNGGLTPDSGLRIMPSTYLKGSTKAANNHAINLPSFPTCAWNSDTYKIWLAQNQHNIDTQKASAVVSTIGGAASVTGGIALMATGGGALAGAGMIAGGVMGMTGGIIQCQQAIGTQEAAEKQADQMRGSFAPSINATMKMHTFTISEKRVTEERAKIIDDYFTVYGYKVNRVGKPSLKNRPSYTYVKTLGCHVQGAITNEDIVKIESIFDKGVTFWANHSHVGDYTVDNSI